MSDSGLTRETPGHDARGSRASKVDGSGARPVGIAVVGLGFMGATHVRCVQAIESANASSGGSHADACRLVAVCDRDANRRSGLIETTGNLSVGEAKQERIFDPVITTTYERFDDVLADPNVDAVSICTQTDTHVDLAIRALGAGKHVLIEKPVAIASKDVQRVADAAAANRAARGGGNGLVCVPGMCMRFWPGWPWVRERVKDGRFGRVLSATFHRLGTPPRWSTDFYLDTARSGGALVDLHIHDADFIRWCFGDPDSVSSTGSTNHLTTVYRYENGPKHVVAEGGWGHSPGFGFRMRYVMSFEGATVDFDLGRRPSVCVYRDGKSEAVELPAVSAYQLQLEHFVACIARPGEVPLRAMMEDAVRVARLLEAEKRSIELDGARTEIEGLRE